MRVLNIIDEDIVNFKKPSMFILMPFCSGKCWKELNLDCSICQNENLRGSGIINVDDMYLIDRYLNNSLTEAMVFGGMEPFDSAEELHCFLMIFRYNHADTVVIYTGYTEEEVKEKYNWVYLYENIIIKYGRYIPDQQKHFDKILGIELASPNQYAKAYNIIDDSYIN